MAPEHVRLRRKRELGARAHQLPHRYLNKAPHAMHNRRAGLNSDRGKAASGMGRFLREVAVANPPPKGLAAFGSRATKMPPGMKARDPIERVQYLGLGEMLKDIGGRYRADCPARASSRSR